MDLDFATSGFARPEKLLDFFDSDMLQIFEFESFLFDHVILLVGQALSFDAI